MAKVTSKYQVTIPKKIAEQYAIRPGDHIDWVAAGDVIRVLHSSKPLVSESPESRVRLFDQATERHRRRQPTARAARPGERGRCREDLYGRGRSD